MATTELGSPTFHALTPRRGIYVITGTLVAFMIVGSLFDFAISQSLYNPSNGFAIFFAAFGEVPAFLAFIAAGALFFRHRNREKMVIGLIQFVGGFLLIVLGTAALAYMPSRYLADTSPAVVAVIGVVLACGTLYVTWIVSATTDRRVAIRVALVLFLVPFIELVLVNVVKIFWERPRMRMIDETPDASFMNWWMPGYDGRDALMASGIAGEEFKSFPSGHTANAATAMLLTAFVALKDSLRPRADLLLYVGFAWAVLVALSRVIAGAHFVTDVTMGLTITFLTILVAYRVAFPAEKTEEIDA